MGEDRLMIKIPDKITGSQKCSELRVGPMKDDTELVRSLRQDSSSFCAIRAIHNLLAFRC